MSSSTDKLRLGLFEIDAEGIVIYYKPEGPTVRDDARVVIGRNLFADVIDSANVRELKELLQGFRRGREPSRTLHFTFLFDQSPVSSRILLARMREQTNGEGRDSVFIHIRRA